VAEIILYKLYILNGMQTNTFTP